MKNLIIFNENGLLKECEKHPDREEGSSAKVPRNKGMNIKGMNRYEY